MNKTLILLTVFCSRATGRTPSSSQLWSKWPSCITNAKWESGRGCFPNHRLALGRERCFHARVLLGAFLLACLSHGTGTLTHLCICFRAWPYLVCTFNAWFSNGILLRVSILLVEYYCNTRGSSAKAVVCVTGWQQASESFLCLTWWQPVNESITMLHNTKKKKMRQTKYKFKGTGIIKCCSHT